MSNKRIDIYVGAVGQTYVDFETAKKNLAHAHDNVQEWEDLKQEAIDLLEKAKRALEKSKTTGFDADTLLKRLQELMDNHKGDENRAYYNHIVDLFDELTDNDYDGDLMNGGNVASAAKNTANAQAIVDQLLSMIDQADEMYNSAVEAVDKYQDEYDNAKATFESMLEDETESDLDANDRISGEFRQKLDMARDFIDVVNEVSDKINETTTDIYSRIGTPDNFETPEEPGEDTPSQPENPGEVLKYWCGIITEEDLDKDNLTNVINTQGTITTAAQMAEFNITVPVGRPESQVYAIIFPDRFNEIWVEQIGGIGNYKQDYTWYEDYAPEGYRLICQIRPNPVVEIRYIIRCK